MKWRNRWFLIRLILLDRSWHATLSLIQSSISWRATRLIWNSYSKIMHSFNPNLFKYLVFDSHLRQNSLFLAFKGKKKYWIKIESKGKVFFVNILFHLNVLLLFLCEAFLVLEKYGLLWWSLRIILYFCYLSLFCENWGDWGGCAVIEFSSRWFGSKSLLIVVF